MMSAHQHDKHHTDTHTNVKSDPHIWLAPPLIKIQAQNIANALIKADPGHKKEYEINLNGFIKELDAIDKKIKEALSPYKGKDFYVFHPSFGYFADAYGLKQKAVEIQGKSPTPKQLSAFITKARANNIKIIFVQPQFYQKSASVIAGAIGGSVVSINPLAKDVVNNLNKIAAEIEKALK